MKTPTTNFQTKNSIYKILIENKNFKNNYNIEINVKISTRITESIYKKI